MHHNQHIVIAPCTCISEAPVPKLAEGWSVMWRKIPDIRTALHKCKGVLRIQQLRFLVLLCIKKCCIIKVLNGKMNDTE